MSELEPARTYSNPTATDVLRRLLDERGVEWMPSVFDPQHETFYSVENGVGFIVTEFPEIGRMSLACDMRITPAQAIAATLGSCNCPNNCTNSERTGTCHVESSIIDTYEYNRWEYELSCGHTIIWEDSEPPRYCPICGRRVEQ